MNAESAVKRDDSAGRETGCNYWKVLMDMSCNRLSAGEKHGREKRDEVGRFGVCKLITSASQAASLTEECE